MTGISGFSFVHNALRGGYPLVEAVRAVQDYVDEVVVVDMESDDGTGEVLQALGVRVLPGKWGNEAGRTLALAHAKNVHCEGEMVLHFEADEVYDQSLVKTICQWLKDGGPENLAVYRLQVEQNFQRVRWYPEAVHRVFPGGSVIKEGHTTNQHQQAVLLPAGYGFLWDCTNCFRDNWFDRVEAQAELWAEEPRYRMVPLHMTHAIDLSREEAARELGGQHWVWRKSPFDLPESLKKLVGMTKYEGKV